MLRQRRTWIAATVIALIGLLFAWLVELEALYLALQQTDWRLLPVALLFFLAGALLISVRFRFLIQPHPAFKPTFHADSIAFLLNIGVHVPAPATRVIGVSRVNATSIPQATSGMVVDRLLEQIMRLLAAVLTISLAVSQENTLGGIFRGLLFVAVGLAAVYWIANHEAQVVPPLARGLGRLPRLTEEGVHSAARELLGGLRVAASARQLLIGLLLSLAMWGAFFLFQLLTLVAMRVPLSPGETVAMAMLVLAVAPPSAPAMAGIYHGVVIGALVIAFPGEAATATAYALLLHLLMLLTWGVLGVWGTTQVNLRLGELRRVRSAASSDAGAQAPDSADV